MTPSVPAGSVIIDLLAAVDALVSAAEQARSGGLAVERVGLDLCFGFCVSEDVFQAISASEERDETDGFRSKTLRLVRTTQGDLDAFVYVVPPRLPRPARQDERRASVCSLVGSGVRLLVGMQGRMIAFAAPVSGAGGHSRVRA